jgi:hypothetical protein
MAGLPPPETARPLVAVATPLRPETVTEKAATSPLDQVAVPPPAPRAVLAEQTPVLSSPAVSVPTVVAAGSPSITSVSINPAPGPTANGTPIAASNPTILPAAAEVAPVIAPPVAKPSTTPAFDLASIVSAIEIPESEQKPSAVPVDLKKIKSAAPKAAAIDANVKTAKLDPKTAIKAKAEAAQPARFWVQIATGDAGALGFDYRKWSKKSAELFKGQSGWTSAWGKTSRLLVGPFADLKAAKKWEADFKKSGGDGFMWKSENGVVVTALKSK